MPSTIAAWARPFERKIPAGPPFSSAIWIDGSASGAGRDSGQPSRDRVGALERAECRADHPPAVGHERHVGREELHQRLHVAAGCGIEEPRGHFPAGPAVGVEEARPAFVDVLTRPPGELPHRGLGPVHDPSDLLVGLAERFAQDEHRPLERRQRLEHDEQRHLHRVGKLHAFGRVRFERDRLRQPRTHVGLPPPLLASEPVDREPGRDLRQVRARIVDRSAIDVTPPEPRILHHVLGLADTTEQPVRDGLQVPPVSLEGTRRGLELRIRSRHLTSRTPRSVAP